MQVYAYGDHMILYRTYPRCTYIHIIYVHEASHIHIHKRERLYNYRNKIRFSCAYMNVLVCVQE